MHAERASRLFTPGDIEAFMSARIKVLGLILALFAAILAQRLIRGELSVGSTDLVLGLIMIVVAMALFAWTAPGYENEMSLESGTTGGDIFKRVRAEQRQLDVGEQDDAAEMPEAAVASEGENITWLRVGLAVLALGLAWIGQAMLDGSSILSISSDRVLLTGSLGLVAGGLLFGATIPRPAEKRDVFVSFGWAHGRPTLIFWAGFGAYLLSLISYLILGETALALLAWAASVVLLIASEWTRPANVRTKLAAQRYDLAALGLIFIAALAMRLWRLDSLPLALVGDTVSHGMQARNIMHGVDPGWIGLGWTNIPRLGFLPEVFTLALFGDNLWGLNMSAVLAGLASLIATYLLGQELYDRRVGWLAAGFLAISYTHLHFSRVAANIDPLPWVGFSLYFTVRTMRSGRVWHALLAGITAGIGFQMYFSGSIFVIWAALIVLYLLATRKFDYRMWLMVGAGFLAALGPTLIVFLENWDAFMLRSKTVSLLNAQVVDHLAGKYGLDTPMQVLMENIERAFLTFSYYGNTWGERNLDRAFFDPITSVMMTLGLGYVTLRPKRFANWLLFSGFIATVLISTALTNDPPFWQRTIVVLPMAGILAALALDRLARLLPLPKHAVSVGLFVILALLGWSNWSYFVEHESQRSNSLGLAAHYAADMPNGDNLIIVQPPWSAEYYEFQFLAPHVQAATLSAETIAAGEIEWRARPATFIFTPEHKGQLAPVFQRVWPDGVLDEVMHPDGQLAFYTYSAP